MGFDAMSYLLGRKLQHAREHHVIYGFHIDSGESDPSEAVTYLADAVGQTPAHMDFVNDTFDWGSWADAFFLPRPCMLKYDGTVDYYLDPADYTKKLDGTASDAANESYGGNAMMEWGRDGKRIWYKIVPDSADPTSASVYIADHQADPDYHAWSFVNNQGVLVEHFYTPIYNGTLDGDQKLRSISGKAYTAVCQRKTSAQEVAAAELNNPGADKLWYTEVYADAMLIDLLLILMSKSLYAQAAFGQGNCGHANNVSFLLGTGTMDDKGLFWGSTNDYGVKVFGMENWWGNQWRRYAGHVMVDHVQRYKLTYGQQDGSEQDGYAAGTTVADYEGYLTGTTGPSTDDFVTAMEFHRDGCFQTKTVGGTSASYWCHYWYQDDGLCYASRGGNYSTNYSGPLYFNLHSRPSNVGLSIGAALSCKPLA